MSIAWILWATLLPMVSGVQMEINLTYAIVTEANSEYTDAAKDHSSKSFSRVIWQCSLALIGYCVMSLICLCASLYSKTTAKNSSSTSDTSELLNQISQDSQIISSDKPVKPSTTTQ